MLWSIDWAVKVVITQGLEVIIQRLHQKNKITILNVGTLLSSSDEVVETLALKKSMFSRYDVRRIITGKDKKHKFFWIKNDRICHEGTFLAEK